MSAPFARPYVDAVREVAGPLAEFESVIEPLSRLARIVAASEELRNFFLNPSVLREKKAAALAAVAEKAGVLGLALKLAQLLLANRRIARAGEVAAALRARVNQERSIVEATVVAARGLDAAAVEALAGALEARTGRKVRLSAAVDAALLGGFVARVESEVWDASLSSRLERARNALHAASGAPAR